MQVQLTKPELEQYVTEKVKCGEFPSAEAVVADALLRVMDEENVPTDEDMAAIDRGAEQAERGELVDFRAFSAELRKKYGIQ